VYKCSCGYETEKGNAYSAHFSHHKGDEHKRLGWADPETGVLYPTRTTAEKAAKAPKAPPAEPKPIPQGTVPAAALSSARPPILFQLGQENIPLDFQDLYEAYQLYSDMRTKGIIKEASFTAILKDGIAFMWTVCAGQPGIVGDRVKLTEVDYGGRPGNDKKEAGVKLATG